MDLGIKVLNLKIPIFYWIRKTVNTSTNKYVKLGGYKSCEEKDKNKETVEKIFA